MNLADLPINVDINIDVNASPEKAFNSLIQYLGPDMAHPEGDPMKMKLEPFPGGRWYRDLGNNQGHFWGHVQVIKKPILLEIAGPLFMSYPALSHVQFRITPKDDGKSSTITLRHKALGAIDEQHREGVNKGWNHMLEGIKAHAESY